MSGASRVFPQPLRVLLVANTLPPRDVSGVGEQVLQLAAGLRARGHEVEVLGRGPGGAAGPKLLFPVTSVAAVRRAVRRFAPHVVQIHESDGSLAALWLAWARRRLAPAPLLVALLQVSYREEIRAVRPLRDRGGRILGRPGAVERRFRRFKAPLQVYLGRLGARLADLVLCPSRATAAEVERDYGLRGARVLPNVTGGFPRPVTPSRPDHQEDDRQSDPQAGYLLFVGRLRIRKGVEVLLAALAEGRRRGSGPVPDLLIAGDGEHRKSLEARVDELRLGEAVRFLGRCDAGRVRGLLAGATALVVPSIYEGMPLVILEAMEAGLPIVASAVSGIPEVVIDGETGWLVPPEDPRALAEALGEVAGNPVEARRRGEEGRQRVEEHFRPAAAADLWEEEVRRALEVRAASKGLPEGG